MNRQEYRDSVRAGAVGAFVCVNCSKDSYRPMSGTNKSKGHKNKYCCMACRVEYAEKVRTEIAIRTAIVKSEIKAIKALGKSTYKPAKIRVACKKCGKSFAATNGGGLHQGTCDACLIEAKKVSRRISKALRRARTRGAQYEQIDPIKVFERDGWRCHMCGTKLKRKDRGTFKDMAPELDHIITLAEGGTHTWENVACSCRKCNGAKGSRSFGQMVLVIG